MHVVAISNRKGGTGKTTVAVNLAAFLAARGLRVLLIDLDSQGHCGVGLGVSVASGGRTAHDLFVDADARLSDAIVATAVPGLSMAPADTRFDHGSGERNDQRLRDALAAEQLSDRFDLVLIDTPPSLDALLTGALLAATRVLVPYVPHPLSFEGVRQLVRALFPIMTRSNRQLKVLGFVPTMQAEHIRQHRAVRGEVSKQFGSHQVLPGIRNDIRLAEAFAVGQPVSVYAPKSRGAEDFALLSDDVFQRLFAGAPR